MPQSGSDRPAMPRASTLPAEVFHSGCGRGRTASGSLPAHHPPQAPALASCCPPCARSGVGRPEGAGRKYRPAGARREGRVRPGQGGGFVDGAAGGLFGSRFRIVGAKTLRQFIAYGFLVAPSALCPAFPSSPLPLGCRLRQGWKHLEACRPGVTLALTVNECSFSVSRDATRGCPRPCWR